MSNSNDKTEVQPAETNLAADQNKNVAARSNLEMAQHLDRLLHMFESDSSSLSEVARELQTHDGLAGKLLKRVNSAEFNLKHSVKNVQHAVAFLGQNRTIEVLKDEITRTEKQTTMLNTKTNKVA